MFTITEIIITFKTRFYGNSWFVSFVEKRLRFHPEILIIIIFVWVNLFLLSLFTGTFFSLHSFSMEVPGCSSHKLLHFLFYQVNHSWRKIVSRVSQIIPTRFQYISTKGYQTFFLKLHPWRKGESVKERWTILLFTTTTFTPYLKESSYKMYHTFLKSKNVNSINKLT